MSEPDHIVVINAGNTRVTAAVVCLKPSPPALITAVNAQESTGPNGCANLAEMLRDTVGDARPSAAVVVNVRPGLGALIETAVAQALGLVAYHVSAADLGPHRYRTPLTLGPDRVANVLGYRAYCGLVPGIVVDAGTATTFECIDASGAFVGGPIAAGLTTALEGLLTRAPALPRPEPKDLAGATRLGQGSLDAVAAGALHGHVALISGLADRLASDLQALAPAGHATRNPQHARPPDTASVSAPAQAARRILCGGFAATLAPFLADTGFEHVPHLTLVGAATVLGPARKATML